MRRGSWIIVAAFGSVLKVSGQTPDFKLNLELRPTVRSQVNDRTTIRWYDHRGRASNVSLTLNLEPGYIARIVQRLHRVDTDADPELSEEYYIEDPGRWRVGKQLMPFGSETILREYARGAGLTTNLVFDDIPVRIAAGDNGRQKLRATFARIGDQLGISVAVGNHIGVAGTSFTQFRAPELSAGVGRGWKQAYGADLRTTRGPVTIDLEFIALRSGETNLDLDSNLSLAQISYRINPLAVVSVAWVRDWLGKKDGALLEGRLIVSDKIEAVGFVRIEDGRRRESGAGLVIRF
ncbi:MAG: hypothetical protein HONBIEJF_00114 [Fimbriimonadaceae bacterium]|nr:hypothetical protein [Fimbriimonadaceae bacterium]